MTLYVTQPALIEVGAKDFGHEGRTLTSSDLSQVTARVVDLEGTELLAETEMIWDSDVETWKLMWTTPATDGTYVVETRGYGIGETEATPTFKRVRIAKRPID